MIKNKIVDAIIILGILAALFVGFLTYKNFRKTAAKQILSTSKIEFQVFLRGVTITGGQNPVKVGEKTFISIRNVPYTELKIVDSKMYTKRLVIASDKAPEGFALVDDFSQFFMYDIIATVTDVAQITKDGPVVGGNKIKLGLPITLEGKDYKFNGTVSDIKLQDGLQIPQPQQIPATVNNVNSTVK